MRKALFSFALTALLASVADAQNDDSAAGESLDGERRAIEEVEVYGRKRPRHLERIVIKARLDFWDLYNTINTVDEFKVECSKNKSAGTNMKQLRCEPQYFTDKMREQTQEAMRMGRTAMPSDSTIVYMTRAKKAEADQYMAQLIKSNPRLLKQYQKLLNAQRAWERSQEPR